MTPQQIFERNQELSTEFDLYVLDHPEIADQIPDGAVPMLRKMFEKRLRGYRAIGYARDDAAHRLRATPEQPVIEHDGAEARRRHGDSWEDQ